MAVVVFAVWMSGGGSDSSAEADPTPPAAFTGQGGALPSPRRQTIVPADPPAITGLSAAILEEPCGALVYAANAHQELPPASLTKIATALVAEEHARLSDTVAITVNGPELSAETDATVMGLEPGQRLTVRDLLYGLLLMSGEDAAIQLAKHVSGGVQPFVALMNQKAAQLGLEDTQFTNPHGLDEPGLYTSAYDMAVLGRELLHRPELAEIVRTQRYQPAWDGPALRNLNLFLGQYPGALGVKTGFTDQAGQTIVAAAERDGRRLIVSVLKSQDLYVDAGALLDWAFASTPPACSAPATATSARTP